MDEKAYLFISHFNQDLDRCSELSNEGEIVSLIL